jgi:hypothetical protein
VQHLDQPRVYQRLVLCDKQDEKTRVDQDKKANGAAPLGVVFSGGHSRPSRKRFFMPMRNRSLPGRHITDCQMRLYMSFRQSETPTIAAAKAGFSAATAYRIEQDPRLPSHKKTRRGRRRRDPLAAVWDSEVVPLLKSTPGLRPVAIFDEMETEPSKPIDKTSRGGGESPGHNNSERIVASKISIPEGRARNRRAKTE